MVSTCNRVQMTIYTVLHPCHIIQTQGRPVIDLNCNAEHQTGCHTYPFTVSGVSHLRNNPNGEPAVLVHHGIVHRWRCGS